MQKNKIGTLFMVSLLALAGVGISYAGWTDIIEVSGSVNTGTVTWEVIDYSGTWVWKWIPEHGKIINYGVPIDYDGDGIKDDDPDSAMYDNQDYELVAKSWAQEGTGEYDVDVFFENLYPCVWFKADIVIEYTGTIPGRINDITYGWDPVDDWIEPLITDENIYATFKQGEEIMELGDQLHENDEVTIELWIHIPQQQELMLKTGHFTATIEVVQWNEYPYDHSGECGKKADLEVVKTVDDTTPYIGNEIEYTVTVTNNGPDTATNVEVTDILPGELALVSSSATKGSYNENNNGIWTVGDMNAFDSESLTIVALVESAGQFAANMQLCMILDGSGSILPGDWTIMLNGIATALRDPTIFPYDGTVELTVIQFSGTYSDGDAMAWVEIGPVVITDNPADPGYYDDVASDIQVIVQDAGRTPLYAGIELAQTTLEGSPNNPSNGGTFTRQVFNLVTDGQPNEYPPRYQSGEDAAEDARDILVATLDPTEDEFDAEAIGSGPDIEWLRTEIVWPEQPDGDGYQAPPFDKGPGWVRAIADFQTFADTISQKFQVIFNNIENCATVTATTTDPDMDNNADCVYINPLPCVEPGFTTLDLEQSTDEINWVDFWTYDPVNDVHTLHTFGSSGVNNYIRLGDQTVSVGPLKPGLYPFYLDPTSVPTNPSPSQWNDFWYYWANVRGVDASDAGDYSTWEGYMWDIINGLSPMFYLKVSAGPTYMLVDGLHYLLPPGGAEETFYIPDDYPYQFINTEPTPWYEVYGDIESMCGTTSTMTVNMNIYQT